MRLYIPELEILLNGVRCDHLRFKEESSPCIIVDFVFKKYLTDAYCIHSAEVSLTRGDESFDFSCHFISKPLKEIRIESKKSEVQSAIIKTESLPFRGFKIGDKLVFDLVYSSDTDDTQKSGTISFIFEEYGWESFSNTCDTIRNAHFTEYLLPVFSESGVYVTLTGTAYDFLSTNYYLSVSNFTDSPIKVYSFEYYISVLKNGSAAMYDNQNEVQIVEVGSNSTAVGVLSVGNRPTDEFDFDLMEDLNENSSDCKATISLSISCVSEDGDIDLISDWIVGEIGLHPAVPTIEESFFEYKNDPKSTAENKPSPHLTYNDFILYSHAFRCLNKHETEMINAIVKIAMPSGTIIEKTVNAAYCATCNKYIILERDYNILKSYGVLLCRQFSFDKFIESQTNTNGFRGWKEQSDLRQLGYTVNAKDNLSEAQRHEILRAAIDSGLYTVESLKSFLTMLIENNNGKPNYWAAVNKWESDVEYISHYNMSGNRNVGVRSISKTNYHYKKGPF